jgi:hypothetical protein
LPLQPDEVVKELGGRLLGRCHNCGGRVVLASETVWVDRERRSSELGAERAEEGVAGRMGLPHQSRAFCGGLGILPNLSPWRWARVAGANGAGSLSRFGYQPLGLSALFVGDSDVRVPAERAWLDINIVD